MRKLKTPVTLHICGEGPEENRLKNMVQKGDPVFFHGFISDAELWSHYRSCDLVIFPSSFEGFGMPPMQALYFSKPCLVSDIPIFRSVYGDFLEYFPHADLERFVCAIEKLLSDRDYRLRRGQAGREYVLKHFTWSGAAEKIETVLTDVSGRRSSGGPSL